MDALGGAEEGEVVLVKAGGLMLGAVPGVWAGEGKVVVWVDGVGAEKVCEFCVVRPALCGLDVEVLVSEYVLVDLIAYLSRKL